MPLLESLSDGDLYARKSDSSVFLTEKAGSDLKLIDPLTGEAVGQESKSNLSKIKVNNALRRTIRTALGGLMFSLLAIVSGNLVLPIVLHVLVDLAVLWVYHPQLDSPATAARLVQGCPPALASEA